MVRTPPGTFPLTDFIGTERDYDGDKFIPVEVKKGSLKLILRRYTMPNDQISRKVNVAEIIQVDF